MRTRMSLLLVLVPLLLPPVARAQADTIQIEQRAQDGATITGGCYRATSEEYLRERCDGDDGATDGAVHLDELGPGPYDVREVRPPAGYHATADFTAARGETTAPRHQPTPHLDIVATDRDGKPMPGNCWLVRTPGQTEGGYDRCDGEDGADDGTTRLLDMEAGDFELTHVKAPTGIDRIDDTTFT